MSQINIKNFVDVNIQPHLSQKQYGTRDTVVLYTAEEYSGAMTMPLKSLSEAKLYCTTLMPNTLAYLTVYFNNGGVKAYVIPDTASSSISTVIDELPDEYICVAFASPANASTDYTNLLSLATSRAASSTVYGTNEKLILARTSSVVTPNMKNFVVKYSSVQGAEMTIAAYLSKVNAYGNNSIFDYAFTEETISAENISDATFKSIISANLNVDITLAGKVRNCGGNCSDGDEITNTFVRIMLQQTLSNKLLGILIQKIKNQSGLNKLYAAAVEELEKYRVSGYLITDRIWEDDNLVAEYNSTQYTIVEKGTALDNGYIIKILPYLSLTTADRAAHKTPPIYIILAEQYGFRKIVITGEALGSLTDAQEIS